MLSLVDHRRLGRRAFLRIGSVALGGHVLNLSGLQTLAQADPSLVRDKSVVLLFLHGGPSQTETFDPKMTAPAGIRSATGETPTRLPGVTFGSTFPRLAERADRLAIVRSFKTGDGKHDIKPVVSAHSQAASLGSVYSRIAGTNHPDTGMPRNVALFPRAVDESTQPANTNFGKFDDTGAIGKAFAPFVPGGATGMGQDLELRISRERVDDRRQLLSVLDRFKHELDVSGAIRGMDRVRGQAFETILGSVAKSFDLSQESPNTLAAYDTAPLVRPEQISRKWNNYNNYVDNAKSLGKLLLLARRLCEAGCGFVTVTTNFVWDMHADQNNAGVREGMQYMGLPLDYAVSAFLDDVKARGLQDDILLVVCGEMGRTPKINARGGRDHWGNLAPLLVSGGGLSMGQVIGQSTRDAGAPATQPVLIPDLISTIMHSLLDIGKVRTVTGIPADVMKTVTSGSPIPGLMT